MKSKTILNLPTNIVNLYLDEEELVAMNIIHNALFRNGYAYVLQKITIKRKRK